MENISTRRCTNKATFIIKDLRHQRMDSSALFPLAGGCAVTRLETPGIKNMLFTGADEMRP
ncbi:Hypothetical predicted protein [Xyrichtys novacula]|uniref:Uncharacterized protein n=1 Tax=Xyrichtys novacula TaxID=13765 RepID=A0AAV1HKX2_XYRNO|nr:Hypothetical predicted protein [Xyrichtys novacula]